MQSREVDTPSTSGRAIVAKFLTALRAAYQHPQMASLQRFMYRATFPVAESFINIAVIKEQEAKENERSLQGEGTEFRDGRINSFEAIHQPKRPIPVAAIFQSQKGNENPEHILVEGRAGIGKSVLCQYLANQWAMGSSSQLPSLAEEFVAVIWLPLRRLLASPADTIAKVVHEQCFLRKDKRTITVGDVEKALEDLKQCGKVLYLLDGYDEVASALSEESTSSDLLHELFEQADWLLTSRPYYVDSQHLGRDYRHLELIGFTDKDIPKYVHRFFVDFKAEDKEQGLQRLLESNTNLKGIAHIPINLELICSSFLAGGLNQEEHLTMTALYENLLGNIAKRHLIRSGIRDVEDLSMQRIIEHEQCQRIIKFLEHLAWEAMQQAALILRPKQFQPLVDRYIPEGKSYKSQVEAIFKEFGLLIGIGHHTRSVLDQGYYFIHLTFQEYFAARYIAHHLDKLVEFIQQHKYNPRYEIVWWFVAGLLKDNQSQARQFHELLLAEPKDLTQFSGGLLVMRCLEEGEFKLEEEQKNCLLHEVTQCIALACSIGEVEYYTIKTIGNYLNLCPTVLVQSSTNTILKDGIEHSDPNIARRGMWLAGTIQSLSGKIIDLLLAKAIQGGKSIRERAIYALGNLKNHPSKIIDQLIQLTDDKEEDVRTAATATLGNLKDHSPEVILRLVRLTQDPNEWVKNAAVHALGKVNNLSSKIIDQFIRLTQSKDLCAKRNASRALSKLKNPSLKVIEQFVHLSYDVDEAVRSTAINALAENLKNPSTQVTDRLVELTQDKNALVKKAATYAIGNLTNPTSEHITRLLQLTTDESIQVRIVATRALGNLKDTPDDVVFRFIKLAQDTDWEIKQAATNALEKLKAASPNAINYLVQLIRNRDGMVSHAAIRALGNLKAQSPKTIDCLIKFAQSGNEWDKAAAVRALGKLKVLPSEVINHLIELAEDESEFVTCAVASALGDIEDFSPEVIKCLLRLIDNEDWTTRRDATKALGNLEVPSAALITKLLKLIKDENEEVRTAVVRALGNLECLSKEVVDGLIRLTHDKNDRVRHVTTITLKNLKSPSLQVITQLLEVARSDRIIRNILVSQITLSCSFKQLITCYKDSKEELLIKSILLKCLKEKTALYVHEGDLYIGSEFQSEKMNFTPVVLQQFGKRIRDEVDSASKILFSSPTFISEREPGYALSDEGSPSGQTSSSAVLNSSGILSQSFQSSSTPLALTQAEQIAQLTEYSASASLPKLRETWIQKFISCLTELKQRTVLFIQAEQAIDARFLAEISMPDFINKLEESSSRLLSQCEEATGKLDNHFFIRALRDEWKLLIQDIQDEINRIEAIKIKPENRVLKAKARSHKFLQECITYLRKEEVLEGQMKAQVYDQLLTDKLIEINTLVLGKSPSCFISYAWGVKEHEQLVVRLAASLRMAGLQVYFDRTDNCSIGQPIDYFIEKIWKVNYVVLVGSKILKRKYDEGKTLYETLEAERSAGNDIGHRPARQPDTYVVNKELDLIASKEKQYPGSTLTLLLDGKEEDCLPPIHWGVGVSLDVQDYRKEKAYCSYVFRLLASLLRSHKEEIEKKGEEIEASLLNVKTRRLQAGNRYKLKATLEAERKVTQNNKTEGYQETITPHLQRKEGATNPDPLTNKAYQHFIGANSEEDQRLYNVWYSERSIVYLLHSTVRTVATSFIPYVFHNYAAQGCSFSEQFSELTVLRNLIQQDICFIATEPGPLHVPHFVYGVLTGDMLLLINPVGLSKHQDLNETLVELHERYGLTIYLSVNLLQKESGGLVSCGPICVELALRMLAQTKEEWTNSLRRLVKSGKGKEQESAWLHRVDISLLLPPTLQDLSQFSEAAYQARLIQIRAAHGDRLIAISSTLSHEVSENTFWDHCENADIQIVMNQLCLEKKTIIEVQATSAFQRLAGRSATRLTNKVGSSPVFPSTQRNIHASASMEETPQRIEKGRKQKSNLPIPNSLTEKTSKALSLLKRHYLNTASIQLLFYDTSLPIEESYINLAIAKEHEQWEKEKVAVDLPSRTKSFDSGTFRDYSLNRYEAIYGTKETILPEKFFELTREENQTNKPSPQRLIVLGRAGIGKTTLCHYLAHQWAKGKLWLERWDLVFYIPLRHLLEYQERAPSLASIIQQECLPALPLNKVKSLLAATDKARILYLLDGYDEVASIIQNKEPQGQLLQLLLQQDAFILSSRPHYTYDLKHIDRQLENIGFLEKDIEKYIRQFFIRLEKPEQADSLLNLLRSNPSIKGIVHVPICLELLCSAWEMEHEQLSQCLNLTMTALYKKVIANLFKRYLNKYQSDYLQKDYGVKTATHFDVEHIEQGSLCQEYYSFLEEVAWLGMQEASLILNHAHLSKALKKHYAKPDKESEQFSEAVLQQVGLLKEMKTARKNLLEKAYYFIHLTFQEFLAARYFVNHFDEEEAFFAKHKYDPRYEIVWWFAAGLLKEEPPKLSTFFNRLKADPQDLVGLTHQCLVLRFLEESELKVRKNQKKELLRELAMWLEAGCTLEIYSYANTLAYYLALSPGVYNHSIIQKTVARLVEHPDWKTKIKLARMVGHILSAGGGKEISPLIQLSNDISVDVRWTAAEMLGGLNPSAEIVDQLSRLITDEEGLIRLQAAVALGKLANSSTEIISQLLSLANHEDEKVRMVIPYAFAEINNPPAEVVAKLLSLAESRENAVKQRAAKALGEFINSFPEIAIQMLKLLCDQHASVRQAAAEAFGKLENPSVKAIAIPELLKLTDHKNNHIRAAAFQALGGLRDPSAEVVTNLMRVARDEDTWVRMMAAMTLGQTANFSSGGVVQVLLKLAGDKEASVRSSATNSLSRFVNSSGQVATKLLSLASNESVDVRYTAVIGLRRLTNPSAKVLAKLWRLADNENERVRKGVAMTLGQFANSSIEIVNKLLKLMGDKNSNVAETAIAALCNISKPNDEVVKILLQAYTTYYEVLRFQTLFITHASTLELFKYCQQYSHLDFINLLVLQCLHKKVTLCVKEASCYIYTGNKLKPEKVSFSSKEAAESFVLAIKKERHKLLYAETPTRTASFFGNTLRSSSALTAATPNLSPEQSSSAPTSKKDKGKERVTSEKEFDFDGETDDTYRRGPI